MSGSSTTTQLRHRFDHPKEHEHAKTTEEVLIEKLDVFLSSIESILDSFENYFKFYQETDNEKEQRKDVSKGSRRNSGASISSIKSISSHNLNLVHQRLMVIKNSVLKTSFTNLEYLYKTLDDQYSYLFSSITTTDKSMQTSSEPKTREILSEKIITTIQYFDDKLIQIDDFIKDNQQKATIDYSEDSSFNKLRFHNFNKALKRAEKSYLHYYELPLSWRENRYIIQGYRFSLHNKNILKSFFHFNHNESMNIWTHVFGILSLIYLCVWHYPNSDAYKNGEKSDVYFMYLFLGSAIKCLLSSVIWHTYSCCASLPTRSTFACIDYTGITVLITCSVIAAEYCSLYNYPRLLWTYITISSLCGITSFSFNWSPYFDKPECRSLRISFFIGLALSGATAFVCMCITEGFIYALGFFFPMVYKSFTWYWIGVLFYGNLIPERWRYDVIINEDEHCDHTHTSSDVLSGNIENCGEEEIDEMVEEIEENDKKNLGEIEHERRHQEILDKHFPAKPTTTPFHRDFLSLWWVDYCFSSHSIWHIFVVFGIIGHYFSVLEMLEKIKR